MSLRRKLLAYGLLGVLAAGLSWLWIWSTERHVERSVTGERGRWAR